ncbi:MAG: phenylalanine--tRNA ligase subunit beta [Clostridiales Family XIII bacterium]|jgi:phenylalanyl-tRNA synthetase beta chain|nr:phenylalanine--tRNA ligase subunit beta [Clostridiales Family XIII bacterium]
MLVPLSWLKEYVDIPKDEREFCDRMIMTGSNIETVKTFGDDIKNVVVGRVLSVRPHEDSDHLSVCMVDVGDAAEHNEPLQIVCGAPNVREDILVPVALHGSELPGGHRIKRGKLRGVESNGMICSAGELGFDDKVSPLLHKDGIWILPEAFPVGADLVEAMGLRETVVDFEITPNRPDCLSIIGMAREAAASFGSKLRYPEASAAGDADAGTAADHISVTIHKPELCSRYIARMADTIVIKESPWWLQRRLMFAGMRPINNIVDITNYVMLEYGHPLHAFDIRTIAGGEIIVDTPETDVKFTTLDGTERTIKPDMLLINDAEGGIAVAGVMGGRNSEIEADTQAILVESASFNSNSVRLTSKKLGIRSEASSRYEKGVPPELSEAASVRVMDLLRKTGSGRVLAGAVDAYPGKAEPAAIRVRAARMNKLLGTDLTPAEMAGILTGLEMDVKEGDGIFDVTPPYARLDLKEEVDFSEEIGRIYGYDRLGVTLPRGAESSTFTDSWRIRAIVRETLTGFGLAEIQTYSFESPKSADRTGVPQGSGKRDFVRLINPLGEDTSVMRTQLLPNLLEALRVNYRKNNENVLLFEIGNTFTSAGTDELPNERLSLAIGGYGAEWDFFALKGVIEALLKRLGIPEARFEANAAAPTFHPGRCADSILRDAGTVTLGTLGEVHPEVCGAYDLDVPVCAAEIDFELLASRTDLFRAYAPLDRYPAVTRDIALVVDEAVTALEAIDSIRAQGGAILESVKLFDIYRGRQIEAGKKSLAFSLVYRAADRTLTDGEVATVHEKILAGLTEKTGAALRDV